jgi:hypothetical protein
MLTSLTVTPSASPLTPGFNPGTKAYRAGVVFATLVVEVVARVDITLYPNVEFKFNDQVVAHANGRAVANVSNLQVGNGNVIKVTITSPTSYVGNVATYTITIARSSQPELASMVVNPG